MKKALIVAHNSRFIAQFELNNIRLLRSLGYEVHCATNFENEEMVSDAQEKIESAGAMIHQICIQRFSFSLSKIAANWRAVSELKDILDIGFDLLHCHTPSGGLVARIAAAHYRKNGLKVIYQAHGFHFFKGAPIANWLLYYPVERLLAHWTDILITINKEDYARAQTFKAKKVCYVPGVGIDTTKFAPNPGVRARKRQELGLKDDEIVLLSVGEVNENKNHKLVIEALAQMGRKDIRYIICGAGPLMDPHRQLAEKLGVAGQLILAGFRRDVAEFYQAADIFVFPSLREGLSVSVMEAMASGLPVVCSRIRGNTDLLDKQINRMFAPHSVEDCRTAIVNMLNGDLQSVGSYNAKQIELFSRENVQIRMRAIYRIGDDPT